MTSVIKIILVLFAGCLAALFYSYFIEPHRMVINEKEIKIDGLDPAFDGLRIVVISDLHAGSHGVDEARIQKLVPIVNNLNADVVVLLGDFVSQRYERKPLNERGLKMPVENMSESLKGITARGGVFAVLGNHDGWYNNKSVKDALKSVGIVVLENEVAFVERHSRKLRFFGMRDHLHMGSWRTFDRTMQQAIGSYEQTGDIIVLQHSPDVFPVINAHKTFGDSFKLMLAGHTHGGQIWLPIVGRPVVPSSFGQKYAAGHIHENGKDLFVTTGIGTSILPFRFMVPPEIAVVTLRSK